MTSNQAVQVQQTRLLQNESKFKPSNVIENLPPNKLCAAPHQVQNARVTRAQYNIIAFNISSQYRLVLCVLEWVSHWVTCKANGGFWCHEFWIVLAAQMYMNITQQQLSQSCHIYPTMTRLIKMWQFVMHFGRKVFANTYTHTHNARVDTNQCNFNFSLMRLNGPLDYNAAITS